VKHWIYWRERVELTDEPGPEAFMILLLSTSAGEQTVVATVPFVMNTLSTPSCSRMRRLGEDKTHRCKAGREVAHDVVAKVRRLQKLCLEEIVPINRKQSDSLKNCSDME